jgi:hypothetical protein
MQYYFNQQNSRNAEHMTTKLKVALLLKMLDNYSLSPFYIGSHWKYNTTTDYYKDDSRPSIARFFI